MSRLSYLLSLTPLEVWRLLRRRLPILSAGPAWTPTEILSSAKHLRGIRFAELLLRQEAVVRRHMPWAPLNFDAQRVVEIGCGPLAGFGPLVIFCGAEKFESSEPEWNPELFFSKPVLEKYLRVFYADLCALYGPRMSFEELVMALHERMTIFSVGFEKSPIVGPIDIILSQSCLEHVFPLDPTVEKLAAIQGAHTRFLHLVDFGNHYPTGSPFEGLYEQAPDDYLARRGQAINLLRAPDVLTLFTRNGIAAKSIASRMVRESFMGTVHPWWRERYDDKALFTQLALVVGPET